VDRRAALPFEEIAQRLGDPRLIFDDQDAAADQGSLPCQASMYARGTPGSTQRGNAVIPEGRTRM